ncbi:hypothetical protein amb0989 [Paramagnetospirillum magneticum AMB-1]|uniref:Uncharacterized protein n=1 Tax=Paramagnetospirillum magneticum (strain ATCC 700264 / AMB-1) TaxID=342108 RepID=Q2W8N2_PARM1|nr:hypothetical protein amb0989 [Paramagnetospirillum magneticum AMB-1]
MGLLHYGQRQSCFRFGWRLKTKGSKQCVWQFKRHEPACKQILVSAIGSHLMVEYMWLLTPKLPQTRI